jgi:hypothetical protein
MAASPARPKPAHHTRQDSSIGVSWSNTSRQQSSFAKVSASSRSREEGEQGGQQARQASHGKTSLNNGLQAGFKAV